MGGRSVNRERTRQGLHSASLCRSLDFWKRVDDGSRPGYAEIVKAGEEVFGAGDVVTFLRYTTRSQFDPETRVAKEFKVVQTGS